MQDWECSAPPWRKVICNDKYNDKHFQVWNDAGELVCIGYNPGDGDLISAALDLLWALVSIGGMPDGYCFCPENRDPAKSDHTGECVMASSAIRKATGEVSEHDS